MLTAKQQRFVDEYLIDLNATQAAIRAGYSASTANQQGPRLLINAVVAAAIDAAKGARNEAVTVDAEWVLRRLVAEAEANLADIYDAKNNLRPIAEWPLIWRQGLIQGVEVEELFEGRGEDRKQIGVVRKIRLDNRVRRIELIGKHVSVNAFQERVAFSGLEGLADRLARIPSDLELTERANRRSPPPQAPLAPPIEPAAAPPAPAGVARPHLHRPDHPPALGDDWDAPTQPTPPTPPAAPAGYRPVLPLKSASK